MIRVYDQTTITKESILTFSSKKMKMSSKSLIGNDFEKNHEVPSLIVDGHLKNT